MWLYEPDFDYDQLVGLLERVMRDVIKFARVANGIRLRKYQSQAARAIVTSVVKKRGDTIVVLFPRQSGKNELQAQLQTFLLTIYSLMEAEIVQVSPTWKPQTQNAMRRLERVLSGCTLAINRWAKEAGYIYRIGKARVIFLSGEPTASVVGATASTLLSCDEAQDILTEKWDKDFAPMAASTNATRVFWGTAWTSQTLLARELKAARAAEKRDGRRRVFLVTADDVRKEVPAYGKFVDGQIQKLGRGHPLIKTQFFSEEIEAEGGLFDENRRRLMQGEHPPETAPRESHVYAFLLDVAGEDEAADGPAVEVERLQRGRDSHALTIVRIDFSTLEDELLRAPRYYVVNRCEWVGSKHTALFSRLAALVETWQPRYFVVDATGVGAGLASFLDKRFPGIMIPFIFSQQSKSNLGWRFIAMIETGRYKEYAPHPDPPADSRPGSHPHGLQAVFWKQCEACRHEVLPGPGKQLRWQVPAGARDPSSGEPVHDDLLLSAALAAVLDQQAWGLGESEIAETMDLFEGMEEAF